MSDEVAGWLQKAEADFQNARILLRQRKTFARQYWLELPAERRKISERLSCVPPA